MIEKYCHQRDENKHDSRPTLRNHSSPKLKILMNTIKTRGNSNSKTPTLMLQHKTLIAVTTPCAPWSELGNKGCMMRESRLSAVCLGRTSHFYGEADEQQTCVELLLQGVCFSCLGCCCASYRTKTHVNESFQIYRLMKS